MNIFGPQDKYCWICSTKNKGFDIFNRYKPWQS